MHAVVVGLLGVLLTTGAPARAALEVDPGIGAFVQHWESASRSIKSIPPGDKERIAAACRELTVEAFDFDGMARATFADIWARIAPAPRQSLASTLEHRAGSSCVDHVQDYDGAAFVILGVRMADDGDRLATANVHPVRGQNVHVTWRLRLAAPGHWKAVDLIVEGRSMRARIRDEFNRVLASRHGNLPAAIELMGKR
jgi:ABC-type transporter MlaC component